MRFCYTAKTCPYANAFWNGTQMYYGTGYAAADDVVGHELTHGFTEHTSDLFYWGQSGAISESISDIIGQIVDRRNGDTDATWALGEDLPAYLGDGLRSMQDPTLFSDPDRTGSILYYRETGAVYDDNDAVHWNSGVGNKTFYLASQGGSFNGRTITGIDTDPLLTKSGRLWLLADQSLTSGSDYADLGAVLDQSCQTLLAAPGSGFTTADCANVHEAALSTELFTTPTWNPQPADAPATCPVGSKRVLFDSESGDAAAKFRAGATWSRAGIPGWGRVAHGGPDSWGSDDPATPGSSSLVLAGAVRLPAGQPAFLRFQHWRYLEHDLESGKYYDGGTVEVDSGTGPQDAAALPWVNGPQLPIFAPGSNPAGGRKAFVGDSRGYLASRVDLTALAGRSVTPRFTMNTDSGGSRIGWYVDDIELYTCDLPAANVSAPTIGGVPRLGSPLTASPGSWSPEGTAVGYQWLRGGAPIAGATGATYVPVVADVGFALQVVATGLDRLPRRRSAGDERADRGGRSRDAEDRQAEADGQGAGGPQADRAAGGLGAERRPAQLPVAAQGQADRPGDEGELHPHPEGQGQEDLGPGDRSDGRLRHDRRHVQGGQGQGGQGQVVARRRERASSASRASAFGKISAGGVTSPAPTWPTPATLPAMPVLICGRIPVRHTLVTSMPVGVPWNSSTGTDQRGFSPERDLVHPPGGGQRVRHRAADEAARSPGRSPSRSRRCRRSR